MNPIEKFKNWYDEETEKSTVRIPSACCLTSIGMDGYPNSRFVSLKEILENKFVITGPLNSKKGIELLANPKASLTFWWTETERQIRVQGDAVQIEDALADIYFKARSKASQIVSQISKQGVEIENITELITKFEQQEANSPDIEIQRPTEWSGFYIIPKRIEFMEFKKSRLHFRELFTSENNHWKKTFLQP
ncbi:pyridoxal 5'-phosphate synthase [Kordia sp. YSTF-M3]|uniref:Pyridoxal 5'-phosphate synthase n=1 Tax=Kordia aestuariivivens TaxID=2759037 RepID=A0ABR7Q931_9FLAO|nr:pyridoxal 5'-phosphate synthase [Kordia aestuariivivens]MBC8754834.1 pyridoxal 5'-phosphate synthase [Kordia aestuariivivens]